MIIQNEKRKYVLVGTVIAGVLLAILFIFFKTFFIVPQLNQSVILLLYSLLGIALIFTVCMFLSTDSRISSLLFGSIFLIITINYFHFISILIQSIVFGLIIGGIISLYVLYNNRFDLLAIAARGLLTIFFLVVIGVLIGSYFDAMSSVPSETNTSELGMQVLFTHLMGVFVAFFAYIFLFYSIVGVKSSNIFVFGPRKTGKTYFMMAFYEHITNKNMKAKLKDDFILSENNQAKIQYSYANFAESLARGISLDSTLPYTIIIYQFSAKIGLLKRPVTWTFLDYAGEHMPELSDKKYDDAIKYLVKETDNKYTSDYLKKNGGTIVFLKEIEDNFRKNLVVAEFRDALITVAFHGYIKNAGKIIFLADGGKVINEEDSRPLLAKEFVLYSRVLNNLDDGNLFNFMGAKKKFCVVVTKLDKIMHDPGQLGEKMRDIAGGETLIDIHENSLKGNLIEKEIHTELKISVPKYKNLENALNDIDFHFIAVSAFANDNPTLTISKKAASHMEPWGFDEVIEFGT